MLLLGAVSAELGFRLLAAPCLSGIGGCAVPVRALLFLRPPKLRLGRGRPGWKSAGWSPQLLAGLLKSPGRVLKSPGRVLQCPGRVLESLWRVLKSRGRVLKPPGRVLKSPGRV